MSLLKQYTVKDVYSEILKIGCNEMRTQFYKKCNELFEDYNILRLKKKFKGRNCKFD